MLIHIQSTFDRLMNIDNGVSPRNDLYSSHKTPVPFSSEMRGQSFSYEKRLQT